MKGSETFLNVVEQKALVLFSAVRANRGGRVGFPGDWRRLYFMFTRAKRGMVALGLGLGVGVCANAAAMHRSLTRLRRFPAGDL